MFSMHHLAVILGVVYCGLCYGLRSAAELPSSITGKFVPTVDQRTNRIVDEDGRERYFHGTNVVFKGPPYYPKVDSFDGLISFCDEDMELLLSMGHNQIRLSVPWAAVEPIDGCFNETYLGIMQDIVAKAGEKYGIYTVIEFHQDAWNAMYCGNGAPDWVSVTTSNNFPMPLTASPVPVDPSTGQPTKETCDGINNNVWTKFYFTFSTSEAVGNLYDQADLRARFAKYWGKLAETFHSSPYLIGYELMNEPWAGDIYKEPRLLVPGAADHSKLQQLYDETAVAIRAVDVDRLILFQGVTWEVVIPIGEKHGFMHAPGGEQYANKSCLTWHCSVLNDITPEEQYVSWKLDEMKRLGVGGYVTEIVGDGGRPDVMDKFHISWMQFTYKSFANLTWDNSGLFFTDCSDRSSMSSCLNVPEVKIWSRTYPKAVAGRTNYFKFNSTSKIAELNYLTNPSCSLPTVLFVSRSWIYEDGADVIVAPADEAKWSFVGPDHIVVQHLKLKPVNITITITPVITKFDTIVSTRK